MTLPLVARECRGGWCRPVYPILFIVVRSPRTCPVLGLLCFWEWLAQKPRPELAPGSELRWRRGLLAPGDAAGLLTRLHRAPPAVEALPPALCLRWGLLGHVSGAFQPATGWGAAPEPRVPSSGGNCRDQGQF